MYGPQWPPGMYGPPQSPVQFVQVPVDILNDTKRFKKWKKFFQEDEEEKKKKKKDDAPKLWFQKTFTFTQMLMLAMLFSIPVAVVELALGKVLGLVLWSLVAGK